jgi:hypothetical protein
VRVNLQQWRLLRVLRRLLRTQRPLLAVAVLRLRLLPVLLPVLRLRLVRRLVRRGLLVLVLLRGLVLLHLCLIFQISAFKIQARLFAKRRLIRLSLIPVGLLRLARVMLLNARLLRLIFRVIVF